MDSQITIDLFTLIKFALVLIALYLAFRLIAMKWSYKISKPHKWDEAVKNGAVSKDVVKLERTYRDKVRFYNFWFQIERLKTQNIKGDFAELGVYQGETAKYIHKMDPERKFILLDTFDGFKEEDLELEKSKESKFSTKNFSDTSLEAVQKYIDGNENLKFVPGYFPDSMKEVKDKKYALVHLDADLYKPTLSALKYFYPRLSSGGVIIVHDYNHTWDGLRKSIEEFASTIPESLSEITDWQGSVMIIKNRV